MDEFLRLKPLYQDRVWGGRALGTALGRTLPPDRPIGESWEIVDRPEAQSVVVGGTYDGLTLREVIKRHSAAVMGPRWPADKPFPLLVKWLDCRERLSLQVHPPAAVAASLGGEPKTENWFIAAAEPGAHLIVGLRPGVTRAQFERAIADGKLEECVNRFPVAAGDSVLVRSGQVHAIDGGNLILEIQQNSDTTYRVHDWGRVGLDGKPRQLHVAESLRSIEWEGAPAQVIKAGKTPAVLANASEFRIRRVPLKAGEKLSFAADEQPRILSIVAGRLSSAVGELARGENVVLPYAGGFVFTAVDDALVLVTEDFFDIDPDSNSFRKPGASGATPAGWNYRRLGLALIAAILFQSLFTPFSSPGDAEWRLAYCFYGLVLLRMIWAMFWREIGKGWRFYEVLCLTSPAWIKGIAFLMLGAA